MSIHFDRAWVLIEQSRPELAEQEARRGLAESPDDGRGHALLALSLAQQEKLKEATAAVETAIHSAPDEPFPHYIRAAILHDRNRPEEALEAIHEAIRLDPENAYYHALLGQIRLTQRLWREALTAAEEGLRLDPEHVQAANVRAAALVKLGRRLEAAQALDAALARDPDDANTHANRGWAFLHEGKHRQALESFREALRRTAFLRTATQAFCDPETCAQAAQISGRKVLRLEPGNEWARQGIVESLKAKNIVYGLMLRYFLWMGSLSGKARWGLILGGYFGARALSSVARSNPPLAPFIAPFLILYLVFVFLTWTAGPLFNLLLRLNRFGRLALTREQIVASNWVGGSLLLAVACLGLGFGLRSNSLLVASFIFGLLSMPLAGTFDCSRGWPRTAMAFYTAVMALTGLGAVALYAWSRTRDSGASAEAIKGLVNSLAVGFAISFLASPWIGNLLMMNRVRE
ncbi:MAG TPA: tetratricopeptide repeat protein [Phycisphaerae bacterium]|nr:tetratricopeptide repeat protein [Phycisphaerae bacterium]